MSVQAWAIEGAAPTPDARVACERYVGDVGSRHRADGGRRDV